MTETVWVLTITTKHGDDTELYEDVDLAKQAAADFARQYWEEVADQVGPDAPEDNDEAMAAYFENHNADDYTLSSTTIHRRQPAWEAPGQVVLITGGPVEGFTFYGPLDPNAPETRQLSGTFSLSWWAPLQPLPPES